MTYRVQHLEGKVTNLQSVSSAHTAIFVSFIQDNLQR